MKSFHDKHLLPWKVVSATIIYESTKLEDGPFHNELLKLRERERVESGEKMKKEIIGEERECSETLNISFFF